MACTVSLDDALLLQPHLPTADEAAVLASLDGSAKLALGRVESFLLHMSTIPRVSSRFVCIICNATLEERLAATALSVKSLAEAFQTIRQSSKLKSLFGQMLAIGNYLNQVCGCVENYSLKFFTFFKVVVSWRSFWFSAGEFARFPFNKVE